MKITDYKEVDQLITIRKNIIGALKSANELIVKVHERRDSGNKEAITGYACYLSLNSDGSGSGINMAGCYVAAEAADAMTEVLSVKLARIEKELASLGVDIDED